jgi:hypothetical protein
MNLAEFFSAASAATGFLAEHPLRWLGVVLTFLVAVESLMFIPYVGFALKLAVAGVVGAKVIAMFAAASAGAAPSPAHLLSAFSLPANAQLALAFGAVLPFAAGMVYLYFKAGPSAIDFFFGNIFKVKPPTKELFVQSKYVMQFFALPFTLLAGAVVLKGLSGFGALSAALAAALANWLPILLLGLLGLAFEWSSAQLPSFMPKWAAGALGGVLLVLFLGWSFAVMYTVSAKVFASAIVKNAV